MSTSQTGDDAPDLLPAVIDGDVIHGEIVGGPVEVIGPVNQGKATGEQVLVKQGDRWFVVSSVVAMFSGFETLVFPSDEAGNVTNWGEVAGGRGCSREEAIAQLEADGPTDW